MAWDINRVVLVGRLSNEVDLTYAPSGTSIAKFGLAVGGRPSKDGSGDNVSFFNIVVWDKSADFCKQYLKKGDRIALDGRLEQRSWTAQDGTRRSAVEIIADRVESLGSPQNRDSSRDSSYQGQSRQVSQPPRPQQQQGYTDNSDAARKPAVAPQGGDYYDNTGGFKDEPVEYDPFGEEPTSF